ncbi:Uncharacterised protein [Klebsiella pneumoniae]|nr:Uncharacterised protein [Klebsiella pneumoniae]
MQGIEPSFFRDAHSAAVADKERDADQGFQLFDVLADRRMGHAQLVGGLRYAAEARHRLKAAQAGDRGKICHGDLSVSESIR